MASEVDRVLLQLETVRVVVEPKHDRVARVWLNRPRQLNALNTQMLEDLCTAFEFLQKQYEFPVIVLSGCGKSFSAGADLKSAPGVLPDGASSRARRHANQLGRRAITAIARSEAITIARVQGHAIGGGFGLMCSCDIRVVTKDATLSLPEVDLSLPLTWGLTARLIKDVGRPKAMELITLCESLAPSEALSLGMINRVAADEKELDTVVDDWAARLASKNETTLHLVKTQFRALDHMMDTGDVTAYDNDLILYRAYLDGHAARKSKL